MIGATAPGLVAAIEYIELGFSILPVWPMRCGLCACGVGKGCKPGKHPIGHLVPRGLHDATTDERQVVRWFEKVPDANIGIATGAVSSLVVLDARREGGPPRQNLTFQPRYDGVDTARGRRLVNGELLDLHSAAIWLGTSEKTLRARVNRREISFRRWGGRLLVSISIEARR